jgi:Tol biopolymer transport system component
LQLVQGPTLADLIAQRAGAVGASAGISGLPLDEALTIATQIADALEAAHEQGIIHRDLKPANVKVRPDGTVKVLDFGLAKLIDAGRPFGTTISTARLHASQSPTITSPVVTQMGVLLGTAAYMSPEQAKGRPADKRSDVWAFGCVLYEMLTGARAFPGDDIAETLAEVIKSDPDWNALPAALPSSVRRLLTRCLTKDPRRRLSDASVARLEIEDAETVAPADIAPARLPRRERVVWISSVALLLVIAAIATVWGRRGPAENRELRLEITTPPTTEPSSFAISPDGQQIIYVAPFQDRPHLWLRDLGSTIAVPLAGTEDAHLPFWSPDGFSVAYFTRGTLKAFDLIGKSQRTIAGAQADGLGGSWNRGDIVLYAPTGVGPLMRISAKGGAPAFATRLRPQERAHVFPVFLPDDTHFLYYAVGPPDIQGVYVGQIGSVDGRRLFDADAAAVFVPPAHIAFLRRQTLFIQRFDQEANDVTGTPTALATNVELTNGVRRWSAAIGAAAGVIVYRAQDAVQRQLTWLDRSGDEVGKIDRSLGVTGSFDISPDGTRLVFPRVLDGNTDLWTFEMARGVLERITFDPGLDSHPLWSSDGTSVIFQRFHNGGGDLMLTSVGSARREEVLLADKNGNIPTASSPDGRFLLFKATTQLGGEGGRRLLSDDGRWGIWALPMAGDRKPIPIVTSTFEERDAQFSPDGRWIAYQSNETGQFEVYAQPFPRGTRVRISPDGGAQIRWRSDGSELFYIALDGRMMAVPIRLDAARQTIDAGRPVPLFMTRIGGAIQPISRQQYLVSPDGQRFLMNVISGQESTQPITLVLNAKALAR